MFSSFKRRLLKAGKGWSARQRTALVIECANRIAWDDFRKIARLHPQGVPSAAKKRLIRSYSRDVLGSPDHAPGLFAYTAWRGKFCEGWIPTSYYHAILIPSWTPFPSYDRKTFIRRILVDPPVTDLAYFVRGFWLDSSYGPIPRDAVVGLLFSDWPHVFVKTDTSLQGLGVFRVSRDAFDIGSIEALGDLVVQRPIQQHQWFDAFTPDSVATIRITTVKILGQPAEPRASFLRFAHSGADVVRSTEAICVAVDERSGALWSTGVTHDWAKVDKHPDSGQPFEGAIIPHFDRLLQFCLEQHDRTPISGLIGWDVTLDRDLKPVLIEFNQGRADISLMETLRGPCFLGLGFENVWRRSV